MSGRQSAAYFTLHARGMAICALWLALVTSSPFASATTNSWTLVGWNNLGMHCMDADYSVMSLLPPYNTIQAQLMDPTGKLVTSQSGYTVTYQAIADPSGSINKTSIGKANFWEFALPLYGIPLPADAGLAGFAMPGTNNAPQGMSFDATLPWFIATGIPIIPVDDAGKTNTYPMMRLTARTTAGQVLATADVVLPVSSEMDCRACHAAGGAYDPNPERDYRLSILKSHDMLQSGSAVFKNALVQAGYNTNGLFASVMVDNTPVLCAKCHSSEALGTPGITGCPPLTTSIHSWHSQVTDPTTKLSMDSTLNRTSCYRCHPGSATRCLRGAMGSAVAADGTMAMQCQSCHGKMSDVGNPNRTGWLSEPGCQSCHTGTATSNNGQIRYTSVFDTTGAPRVAVNQTFAVNSNTPAAGYSLYRFSKGHGNLQCAACHGSTHAEYVGTGPNDNIESKEIQGHIGKLAECTACHNPVPSTVNGGPHGLHPIGQAWVSRHPDVADSGGTAQCQACHGTDLRGTVLSRSQSDQTVNGKTFWRGLQVGCYTCHNGPGGDGSAPTPAVVQNASVSTAVGAPVNITLNATGTGTLTLRIVTQSAQGTVALNGKTATYYPAAGYNGTDRFTFAANNGYNDSNLGTVTITVGSGTLPPPPPPPTTGAQPDLSIKTSSQSSYTGVGVLNTSGANQIVSQNASPGQARAFDIALKNNGTNAASFKLKGGGATSSVFTVQYFDSLSGGNNITASVKAGTYAVTNLAAGANRIIRVQITPAQTARNGASQSVLVTATSANDTTKTDTVKATVTVATTTRSGGGN